MCLYMYLPYKTALISVFAKVTEVSDGLGPLVSTSLIFDDILCSLHICEVGALSVAYVSIDHKYLVIYENKILSKGHK